MRYTLRIGVYFHEILTDFVALLILKKIVLSSLYPAILVPLDFYITRLVVRANLEYQGLAQEKYSYDDLPLDL